MADDHNEAQELEETHLPKATKEASGKGCVYKCYQTKWAASAHGSYRYQGWERAKDDKSELYNVDFTDAANKSRLPAKATHLTLTKNLYTQVKYVKKGGIEVTHDVSDPRDDKKAWWVGEHQNFEKKAWWPYKHNYHHIMPVTSLSKALPLASDRAALQKTGYNVNAGGNVILLPMETIPADALRLPDHPYGHPAYNDDCQAEVVRLVKKVKKARKSHKMDDGFFNQLKSELEDWSKDEFDVIVDWGGQSVGTSNNRVNSTPMPKP